MDDNVKRNLILAVGIGAICIFLYFVFITGAGYGCSSGGGVLAKGSDGMRCLDLEHTDVCRDYNGKIIKKPESKFKLNFNMTDYSNLSGD